MAFKKNSTSRISTITAAPQVQQVVQQAKRKPVAFLVILGVILLLAMALFTVFSGISFSKKPTPNTIKPVVTGPTPQELAEEATLALRKGDTEAFLELLDTKIKDPNIVNTQGDSLLVAAATLGNMDAVQMLIAMGADVNKQNLNTRDTAVLRAVYTNHDDIVQLLVSERADLNLPNNYKQTPMGLAVEKQKGQLVDLFLANGVKAGLDGQTLLRSSAQKNLVGVLGMLKGGVNPNVQNEPGNTPLIISASLGDTPAVRALLAYRADVNMVNKEGNSAVLYAARYNHPDTLLTLLSQLTMQYRADINLQNSKGETALYWAALKGYAPVVKILLAYDADRNLKTKEGLTALDAAKKYKRKDVINLFEMNPNQLKDSFNQELRERKAAQRRAQNAK